MDEQLSQLSSVARALWKHRWLGLWVACGVAVIGSAAVFFKAEKYEATARIFVDTQSILKPLMSGMTVPPNTEQQVMMLSRTLVSRPNVEKLIQMADLEPASKTTDAHEALIDRLTKTLEIRNAGRDNLYTLSFRDSSPQQAKRVVESLVAIFVESSQGGTRKDSAAAKKFIDEQIAMYVAKLDEAETRLKEFKVKNIDIQAADGKDMVGQAGVVNAQLSQARLDLREAENARSAAKAQMDAEKAQFAAATARNQSQEASISAATAEIDGRIEAQKRNLDLLLQRFTEQHPDVIGARRLISELEETKRREVQELRKAAMANPKVVSNNSLAYQELSRLLATTEVQVASLSARVGEYEARASKARSLLKSAPQVEAELAQLNRDYEVNKKNYNDLVARRESASLTGNLEGVSGIADFRLIDPPRASPRAVVPNRLTLLPLAFLAALGAGLAAAYFASELRAVFFDVRTLRQIVNLPILGVVTLVRSEEALRSEKDDLKKFMGVLAGLAGVFVLGMAVLSLMSAQAG